jgi:hypothetical protein
MATFSFVFLSTCRLCLFCRRLGTNTGRGCSLVDEDALIRTETRGSPPRAETSKKSKKKKLSFVVSRQKYGRSQIVSFLYMNYSVSLNCRQRNCIKDRAILWRNEETIIKGGLPATHHSSPGVAFGGEHLIMLYVSMISTTGSIGKKVEYNDPKSGEYFQNGRAVRVNRTPSRSSQMDASSVVLYRHDLACSRRRTPAGRTGISYKQKGKLGPLRFSTPPERVKPVNVRSDLSRDATNRFVAVLGFLTIKLNLKENLSYYRLS